MPPTQLPLTLAQRHNNQQLFSDHYLNVTLPQRPEWRLLAHDAGAALAVIAPIVRDFLRAPAQNEAQTEENLIKPVLRALGHTFEVQAALKTPDGTKKPDYIFYRDQAALEANKPVKVLDEAALARGTLAVGNAKHWDRPLDVNLKSAGDTIAEVREQERLYADLRAELTRKHQQLADVAAAQDFGLSVDATLWKGLSDYLTRGGFEVPQYATVLRAAAEQAAAQRFFHWDLEFPEVFFDRHGQPLGERGGFDTVIGNPPYVRQEQLAPIKPYLAQAYPETYAGTADLYVYFVNQGLRVLRQGGRLAYIASNSWLRANYAGLLRNFLRTQATVDQLIDLGDNRVFADAPDVYPAILIARRDSPPDDHAAKVAVFSRGEGVKQFNQQVVTKLVSVSIHDQADTGWQLGADEGRRVLAKLLARGQTLGEVVHGKTYYGFKTGFNEAFIISRRLRDQLIQEDPECAHIIKPIVNGEDVRSWYLEQEDRWLIYTPWSFDIDKYPSIKQHLARFRPELEARPECRAGRYNWWCLARYGSNYAHEYENPKVFWPEMAKQPRFAMAGPGIVGNKTTFMIPDPSLDLIGILMSRAIWFAVSNICAPIGERAGMLRYLLSDQYMVRLPIPDAPAADRLALGDLAMKITAEARARYELHRKARRRILADLGRRTAG